MGVQTDPLQTLEPHEERGPAEDVGVEVGFRSASPQGGMEWLRGLWPEGPRGPEDPAAAGLREAEARVAWLMRRLWEEGRDIANLREHIRSLENERLEWREAVVAAARGHITRLRSALRREEERTAALAAQLRERGWEPEEEVVFPAAAARGPETEGSEAERSLRVDPTDAEVGVAGLPGPQTHGCPGFKEEIRFMSLGSGGHPGRPAQQAGRWRTIPCTGARRRTA